MENEWKSYSLGEICSYSKERINIQDVTNKNYISTENMFPDKGGITEAATLPNVKSVSRYEKGDTLISNIRPYFKKIWFSNKIGGASNDVLVIKGKSEKVFNKYLYYFLTQDKFFDYVMGTSKGTKMPRGDKDAILKYDIKLPPLDEQKAIAKVLSDLDEKIGVNNKINKKLEEMAQAIFKQWFVDFEFPNEDGKPYKSSGGEMVESELGMIPKGWQIKKIKDLPLNVTDYVANGSFKSLKDNVTLYDEENYALYIRNTDLKAKFSSDRKYVDKSSYEFLQKTKLFGYEVIISNVGDVGSVYLCPVFDMPMTLGSNVIMINTLENNIDLNIFVFRMFKSFIGQHLIDSITGGSAQPKFNKTDFRNMDLIIPSEDLLEKYNQVAKNIESLILFNDVENKKVGIIRDTLLPKLMSGEIRVPID